MDFREQRSGDLNRAATRAGALHGAAKTRGLLERYVSSRRAPAVGVEPVTQILWGRIALSLAGVAVVVLGLVLAIRR